MCVIVCDQMEQQPSTPMTSLTKIGGKKELQYIHSNVPVSLPVLLTGKVYTKYITPCSVLLFIKYTS
jgi:hypothetical protein